jgi:hypothetical protein
MRLPRSKMMEPAGATRTVTETAFALGVVPERAAAKAEVRSGPGLGAGALLSADLGAGSEGGTGAIGTLASVEATVGVARSTGLGSVASTGRLTGGV